jgi:hypothetical protein
MRQCSSVGQTTVRHLAMDSEALGEGSEQWGNRQRDCDAVGSETVRQWAARL